MPRRRTATQVIEETLPQCVGYSWVIGPYRRKVWSRYAGRVYHIRDAGGWGCAFWNLRQVAKFLLLVKAGNEPQWSYDVAVGRHWDECWDGWNFNPTPGY